SAGLEYGARNWLVWANGGGQRAGDYETPLGRVTNSYARDGNASGGFGYFSSRGWFSADYGYDSRRYRIPVNPAEEAPEVGSLNPRRHSVQARFGMRDLASVINSMQFSMQYNDYRHEEIAADTGEVNTAFKNKTFLYRGVFDERRTGKFSGSFGFWGLHRDYTATGAEALAPPTTQNAFAAFALQRVDFEYVGFQFGGRVEHNGYAPDGLRDRSFTGFSGAAGVRIPLPKSAALVVKYTHSSPRPALGQRAHKGPDPGNATY